MAPATELVLITDPGPDPDDAKALLIAGTRHRRGAINLRLVVANGGGAEVRHRARLALCLLDHVGARQVPVAVGSKGNEGYDPGAYEYALRGFGAVDEGRIQRDGHAALMGVLKTARPASITVVCISSLRDLADVIADAPELVLQKVARVAVQAGLEWDEEGGRWAADTSMNNEFDRDAATAVYDFCFGRGLPLTVVSRHAVPLLPMQLARSFAERTESPVMAYLANAQFLGLAELWRKVCDGELPERCTKLWYFQTFCGVHPMQFAASGFDRLDADAEIIPHLNGFVKPYDVVALMSVLPGESAKAFGPREHARITGADHLLYLAADHAIEARHVVALLRAAYHDVVLQSAPKASVNFKLARATRSSSTSKQRFLSLPQRFEPARGGQEHRMSRGTQRSQVRDGADDGVLDQVQITALLERALNSLRARTWRARIAAVLLVAVLLVLSLTAYFLLIVKGRGSSSSSSSQLSGASVAEQVALVGAIVAVHAALPLMALSLEPIPSHARATTLIAAIFCPLLLLVGAHSAHRAVVGLGDIGVCAIAPPPLLLDAHAVVLGVHALAVTGTTCWLGRVWARTAAGGGYRAQTARLRALWRLASVEMVGALALVALHTSRCLAQGARIVQAREAGMALGGLLAGSVALSACLLVPSSRARVKALLLRSACGLGASRQSGLSSALAPLLGYGAGEVLEPTQLVAEALRGLHCVTIDPDTPLAERLQQRCPLEKLPSEGSPSRESGRSPVRAPRPPRLTWLSAASSMRHVPTSSTTPVHLGGVDRATQPEQADFFVLHCAHDDTASKLRALRSWRLGYYAEHREWPTVWMREPCADPYVDRERQLAHEVVAMCRARRLLLLLGPSSTEHLGVIVRLLAWVATGGAVDNVEVLVLGQSAAERQAVVAAIDAFHVAYANHGCRRAASGAGSESGSDPGTRERPSSPGSVGGGADYDDDCSFGRRVALQAIELAGVSRVNELVRALLPAVQRAACATDSRSSANTRSSSDTIESRPSSEPSPTASALSPSCARAAQVQPRSTPGSAARSTLPPSGLLPLQAPAVLVTPPPGIAAADADEER